MGLFNFASPSDNAAQPVQLIVNDETITVSAAEAEGLSVVELFQRFASSVCDVTRINRFVSLGRIIDANTPVEAGTVYSGAIASESKGLV